MREKTYRIGEAADMLRLKSYVLRFWETEFPQLAPLRTDKGQRLYTDYHIALLHRIRQLLHEQGMTIEGARRVLAAAARADVTLDAIPPYAALAPAANPAPVTAPAYNSGQAGLLPPAPMAGQLSGLRGEQKEGPLAPHSGPNMSPLGPQAASQNVPQPYGQPIDRTVVREMREELLALRSMLLAED